MAVYRFFIFKDDGDVTAPAVRFDFPDDDAAMQYAKTIINGHPIEIWRKSKKVVRVTPANGENARRTDL